VRWINTVIRIIGRMTVGARPILSTEGVGGGETRSERGVVELAVAVTGSRGGGGPTVVTFQKEWWPAV